MDFIHSMREESGLEFCFRIKYITTANPTIKIEAITSRSEFMDLYFIIIRLLVLFEGFVEEDELLSKTCEGFGLDLWFDAEDFRGS